MEKVFLLIGLCVVLVAGPASAEIVISLVGPVGLVNPGADFTVDVVVTSDISLTMVQVVFDSLDPGLTLTEAASGISGLVFVNPPDAAVADYFPGSYPALPPGTFTAMTLTFATSSAMDCEIVPLNLVSVDLSTFSTVVFDSAYDPIWDVTLVDGTVTICVPEPVSMGLLALVSLGSVLAARKK